MPAFTIFRRQSAVSYIVATLTALAFLLLISLGQVAALTPVNGDFEAESITSLPTGSIVVNESAASGGKALAVEQSGTVTKTTTTAATNKIVVSARGSQCKGAPNMTVKIDGVQVIATTVSNSSSYAPFSASTNLAAGSHTVSVSFSNDYWTGSRKCDRNLYLDKVEFVSTNTDSTNPTVTILNPLNGGNYSGLIPAQANASDNVGVTKVDFYLDGALAPLKSDTTSPYCVADDSGAGCTGWDTKVLADRTHTLTAKAYDAAGNKAEVTNSFTTNNAVVKYPPSVQADGAASGGSDVFMHSNGRAYKQATTPAITAVTITAKGDQCQGAPIMIVKFDNVQVASVQVTASTYTAYPISVAAAAGAHTIEVRYENDFYPGSCDRNLFVDKVEFTPVPSAGDTEPPSAPVLSGVAGNQQITLNWTPSTDNVGVVRYEVWKDNTYLAKLSPTAPYTYSAVGLTNGTTYKFRVVAYDAANNLSNSNDLDMASSSSGGTTTCATPAPFPSRLKTSGRKLIDENGCVMPSMKGFSMHAATGVGDSWTWPDSDYADIAKNGGRVLRTVVIWRAYESTQGTINSINLAALDQHIARAQRHGMYVELELHLNTCSIPGWTLEGYVCGSPAWDSSGRDETDQYIKYGQKITQTLAQRYSTPRTADGLTINPKTVLGFGLNEPPQDSATINGNNSIPTFESQQRQMISWFRQGGAPDWIGFVSLAYASQKPYLASPKISADPHAYDAVGGNVIFDAHDYLVYNSNEDANTDSRQGNGAIADTRNFNPGAHWLGLADPHSYTDSATHRAQMKSFLKPFDSYATAAQMPLMLGEFGWNGDTTGGTGKSAYYSAKREAFDSVKPAIQTLWIYANSKTQDQWSPKTSATTWDPDVLAWLQATSPY